MPRLFRFILIAALVATAVMVGAPEALAQEAAAATEEVPMPEGISLIRVIRASGPVGILLWIALFATSAVGFALILDSFLTIRQSKIIPGTFVGQIQEAMQQGDLMKAVQHCNDQPGSLSNILGAAFANVEEGFEAVQDAVRVSAELEGEKLMQRVAYLNLVGNIAPMLGLMGTVQGMILAFANLAQAAGAAKELVLADNISQALWTTMVGLLIAVPAVGFFYYFRNRAAKIILTMEGLTLDQIKVLRNVEVVSEEDEDI